MKKAVSFILALILVSMLLLPVGAEENASSMLVTKGALTYAIDDNFTTKTNAFCLGIILCNVSRSFDYLIYPYYPAYTS